MGLCSTLNLFRLQRNIIIPAQYAIQANGYAKPAGGMGMMGKSKKGKGKLGPMIEKKILPVEEDTKKLVNFVCGSNILKEGKDIELKPDSEYPDWLWSIRTGPPPTLEEMDPESKEYWKRIRTMGMRRNNQLAKLKRF